MIAILILQFLILFVSEEGSIYSIIPASTLQLTLIVDPTLQLAMIVDSTL